MGLDLAIRNGTIVDGSGAPRFQADIGIQDGQIVEIGRIRSGATQVIDAEGRVVAPGFIDTDMTKSLNESQQEKLLERVPAGRLGSPEEVAGLVDYLVSEQAAYINGETIHINGGLYMG